MKDIYIINPTIDYNLAKSKGYIIDNKLSNLYIELQRKYYILLQQVLNCELNLEKLKIELYRNNIQPVDNEKDEYFSIVSNLNIEILDSRDLDILCNEYDFAKKRDMIIKTLKEVITAKFYFGLNTNNSKILYKNSNEDNLKNNDSLVLRFSFNKYYYNQENNWNEYSAFVDNYIDKMLESIKEKLLSKLSCNVEFIIECE